MEYLTYIQETHITNTSNSNWINKEQIWRNQMTHHDINQTASNTIPEIQICSSCGRRLGQLRFPIKRSWIQDFWDKFAPSKKLFVAAIDAVVLWYSRIFGGAIHAIGTNIVQQEGFDVLKVFNAPSTICAPLDAGAAGPAVIRPFAPAIFWWGIEQKLFYEEERFRCNCKYCQRGRKMTHRRERSAVCELLWGAARLLRLLTSALQGLERSGWKE